MATVPNLAQFVIDTFLIFSFLSLPLKRCTDLKLQSLNIIVSLCIDWNTVAKF